MPWRVSSGDLSAASPTWQVSSADLAGSVAVATWQVSSAGLSGTVATGGGWQVSAAGLSGTALPTVSAGSSRTVGAWDRVDLTGSPAGGTWTKVSGAGTTPGAGTTVTVTAVPSNTPGASATAVYRYTHTGVPADVSVTSGSAESFYITAGLSRAMWDIWLDEYGSGSYGLGTFGG